MNRVRRVFVLAIVCALGSASAWPAEVDDTMAADPAAWRHIALDRALGSASEVTDAYRRAEVLANAAKAQALIGDSSNAERTIHAALAAAAQVREPSFQGWVLHEIVLAQIAVDDMIGARRTADRIASKRPQSAALAAIANLQVRGRNIAAAQATATQIRDASAAGDVWRQIVVAQIAAGSLTSARETVRRINDGFYQALASGDVAVADVRAGNVERAHATAAKVRKSHRAQVYGRIALARVDTGDVSGTLETLAKIDDELYRALVQGRIAAQRAAVGDSAEAQQLFAAALSSIDAVRDRGHRKAVTLSQLARIQAASGDEAGARECLRRAIAAAASMPNGQQRDDALDVIARSQARVGDSEAALATALQIDDHVSQALLIRDVIALQAKTQVADTVIRNSAVVRDPLTETAALFGVIGVQLLRKDQAQGAAQTIDAARDAVRSVPDLQMRPAAFAALAAARATIGDMEQGRAIFEEALTAAGALERSEQRAAAYVRIVNALDERLLFLGQPARSDIQREL